MESLERALTANRADVERELRKAESELEALRSRELALESAIARARYLLGLEKLPAAARTSPGSRAVSHQPLHDALILILRDNDNQPMTARELADEVNRRQLYRKADGSPVEVGQIHARVHNYERLFTREGGRIRLRDAELRTHDPRLLEQFNAAMLEVYDAAMREVGYSARRFLYMTRRRGGHDAARHLLAKSGVSEGFQRLASAGKLSLTMEYQVLRPEFAALFSPEEREEALKRLRDSGLSNQELPT
jgi:hypothetical protein